MKNRPIILAWALALGFAFVTGCGDGGPKLAEVKGTVTYKSAPFEGATVTFQFTDGNQSTGVTDKEGKFTMTTGGRPGAPLGVAKVGIGKVESSNTWQGTEQPKPEDMAKMYAKKAGGDGSGMKADTKPKNALPGKYSLPDTSGLTADVKASGNDFVFDLVD